MEHNPIFATKEDAEAVFASMKEIVEMYDEISVEDLKNVAGNVTEMGALTYLDHKSGWEAADLKSVEIKEVEHGYLLDLPTEHTLKDVVLMKAVSTLAEEVAEKVMQKLEEPRKVR